MAFIEIKKKKCKLKSRREVFLKNLISTSNHMFKREIWD